MPTFADGESNASVRTKINNAITKVDGFGYFGHLQGDYTLTNTVSVQKLFDWSTDGALTLPTGVYKFKSLLYITSMDTGGSSNAAFHLVGAGTATLSSIYMMVHGGDVGNISGSNARSGSVAVTQNTIASMVTSGTGSILVAHIEGVFDVTVTGTIIPSIALAVGAAAVVKAGSFFGCDRLGDTGVEVSSGWS